MRASSFLVRPAQFLRAPLVAAWGAYVAAVGAAVAYTQLAIMVLSTAYSLVSASKQKKKMRAMLAGLDEGRTEMIKNPLAPRRLIYGECLVSGVITFFYQKPGGDGFHYMVLTLASHPVQEIGQIRLDNHPVGAWAGTQVNNGPFKGMIDINKALGTLSGERNTPWESQMGTSVWSPQHLGKGVARLHLRYKWDSDKFPQGLPNVTAMVKGAKVYDPRDTSQSPTNPASWKYSNNAALCAAHFLHTRKGVPYSRIVKGALITAANVCSELVPKKGGGTEPRYRCNGVYTYDQNPMDALEELAETMAGSITDAGGTWTIKAGAWTAPVANFTDSDIVSEFRCSPRFSRSDTYNGVRGTYFSPENDWAAADFPAVKNDTYRDWDGGVRLWKDVAYSYITSPSQAQRVAKIDLEKNRQQITIEADFKLKALRAQPGDNITLTRANLGWVNKPFEVQKWDFKVVPAEGEGAGGASLAVGLSAQETAPAVYNWSNGEETTIDLAPNIGLVSVHNVAAPATFKLAQPAPAEETALPRIKASWNQSSDPLVRSGGKTELQFRKDQESLWTHWSRIPGSHTHDFVNDLAPNEKVWCRARHINQAGVRSEWATASITPIATNPTLDLSHWAIGRMSNGAFHSPHLILRAKAAGQPYAGRYRVRLQVSATEFHHHYFSQHDQPQHHFGLSQGWGNVINVEVTLFKRGHSTDPSTWTDPIETKLVPVIKNGQDGLPGAPGGSGGGQYTLALNTKVQHPYFGYEIGPLGGGGAKNAGSTVSITAPASMFHYGSQKSGNFSRWEASGGAAGWIANVNARNTTIQMNGAASLYATYYTGP